MISYLLVRKNYGRGPPYDVFETVVMKFICRNFRKKKYSDRSRGEKLWLFCMLLYLWQVRTLLFLG